MTQWLLGPILAVACGANVRNVEEKIPAPKGLGPLHAVAVLDKGGTLLLRRVQFRAVPQVRQVIVNVNGFKQIRQVTDFQYVIEWVTFQVAEDGVQVYETNGKRLNPPTWKKRLKKETHVLMSSDEKKVDPLYLQVIKEGTLILVVPEWKLRLMPRAP